VGDEIYMKKCKKYSKRDHSDLKYVRAREGN
jgi:hypothetical protein